MANDRIDNKCVVRIALRHAKNHRDQVHNGHQSFQWMCVNLDECL